MDPVQSGVHRRKLQALEAGERAEHATARALRRSGWEILHHRWTGGGGEIDLIAHDRGRLRFVEVKLRQVDDPGGFEAISGRKLARMERAAEAFLQDWTGPLVEACFLAVLAQPDGDRLRLTFLDDPV